MKKTDTQSLDEIMEEIEKMEDKDDDEESENKNDSFYDDSFHEAPDEQEPRKRRKGIFRTLVCNVWFWLLMLFPTGLLIREICQKNTAAADFYRDNIYHNISVFFNNATGYLPFSLGEMILLSLPLIVILYLIFASVGIIRSKGKRLKKLLLFFIRPLSIASLAFFLYVTNCGVNYFSSDFTAMSGLKFTSPTTEQLHEICVYLADRASENRSELKENKNGVTELDYQEMAEKTKNAVNNLHVQYNFIADGYSLPKSVLLSRGMSYLELLGVYFPWTFEANVNTDLRGYSMPFTMCHELSHLRGFMHEEDANFIAYLACIYSKDPALRYSGYLSAVRYVSGYLRRSDMALYRDFQSHLSDGVYRDLIADSEYWTQFETPIAETASKINDTYLKTNAQLQGVKSYGKVAELIIAHYQQEILPDLPKTDKLAENVKTESTKL